jgi:N6-adenosine-specific RNA methylase IME4
MQFHPIAGIFPLLPDDELAALADDIKSRGLHNPVVLFDGKVLDGRNRQTACLLAGVEPSYREFNGTVAEAFDFVWSENVHRRHLQSGQSAACFKKREMLEAELAAAVAAVRGAAKERQRKGGGDQVSADRPVCQTVDKPNAATNADLRTDAVRAKMAGTNRQYIHLADKLADKAPELLEKVAEGGASLTQAARELKEREREEKRRHAAEQIAAAPTIDEAIAAAKFSTICVDPPWDWGDEGDNDQLGRGRTTYGEMSYEELLDLPIADKADDDCHIYLWITNRSLPKGFALLESWGFRYVTCITWVKPSFGMGNYFRGQTEQVLFGVRGSLALKRRDCGTVLNAPRGPGGHSSKPDEFYDLVESCSPAPYLDVFSRRERADWCCWGGQLT